MNVPQLFDLLKPWDVIESSDTYGGVAQPARLLVVAREACHDYSGDLVEIGCQYGTTTVKLAQVAREFGRRVLAIDPYEIGTQNCDGGELETFLAAIAPWEDVVEFHRLDSRDPAVTHLLRSRELAFAFVDGLHTYAACRNDILNTAHAGLLAVDDVIWSAEVRRAFYEAEALPRSPLHLLRLREGYLL